MFWYCFYFYWCNIFLGWILGIFFWYDILFNCLIIDLVFFRIFFRLVFGERFLLILSFDIFFFFIFFNRLGVFCFGDNWFGIFFFMSDFGGRTWSFCGFGVVGGVRRFSVFSFLKDLSFSCKFKIIWEVADNWFSIVEICDFSLINLEVFVFEFSRFKSKVFAFSSDIIDLKYRDLING